MFSTLLRAGITLLLSAPLLWLHLYVAEPLVDQLDAMAAEGSPFAGWLATFAQWFAVIVLLSLVIWVVADAVAQRDIAAGGTGRF